MYCYIYVMFEYSLSDGRSRRSLNYKEKLGIKKQEISGEISDMIVLKIMSEMEDNRIGEIFLWSTRNAR